MWKAALQYISLIRREALQMTEHKAPVCLPRILHRHIGSNAGLPCRREKCPDVEELRSHVIISGHNYVEPPLDPVPRSISSLGVVEDATGASRKCND